jgi:hypothetical protein
MAISRVRSHDGWLPPAREDRLGFRWLGVHWERPSDGLAWRAGQRGLRSCQHSVAQTTPMLPASLLRRVQQRQLEPLCRKEYWWTGPLLTQ